MAILSSAARLKKELSLFNIYAIATGATLSSGFFLLPGLAAAQAGPAFILSFLVAIIPLIPGIMCTVELATAMPRSGGVYYFLDRSLGPLVGTIGGLGVWLVVVLKTAFALVGIGAYLRIFFPTLPMFPISAGFALLFGTVNLLGAKKTGLFQSIMVLLVLGVLVWFSISGAMRVNPAHFEPVFQRSFSDIVRTAGLLCVSYIGLTKIAAVAEEVKDPDRNLPRGIFLALITSLFIYIVGSIVMVGIVPGEKLAGSLIPAALTGEILGGRIGRLAITVAAILAFSSVANAGILSASRYPLALGRDHLLPRFTRQISKRGVPTLAIIMTVALIVFFLFAFDAAGVAKLAGAFQLFMFAFTCIAVIVMRESLIESYDPGFRTPFYPWLHILGALTPIWFIFEMGRLSVLFTLGLVLIGVIWYYYYGRRKINRGGAIFHMFARLGKMRFEGLDRELRGILREKGLRAEDPFDRMVARAGTLDIVDSVSFEEIVHQVSLLLMDKIGINDEVIGERFLQGTRVGATPVSHGSALPHIHVSGLENPELIMVRCRPGVRIDLIREFWGDELAEKPVYALFFLAGPEDNPKQHLRLLAQIAECIDGPEFLNEWLTAPGEIEFKEILLRDERFFSLILESVNPSAVLIGLRLRDIRWPAGTLVALIHRRDEIIIPHGDTLLEKHDRLTVIGEPSDIREIRELYLPHID